MLKVAGGVGGSTGQLSYQGTWNASTNTPTLASGVGVQNHYYVVSVAGTTNLDGITDWQVNDWALFNGSVWQKIDQSDLVVSVNGQTGVVVLGVANIAGAVPNTVNVLTSGLLSGGGALTGNVTIDLTSVPVANVPGAVPNTINVLAGGLLSGGGALTSNVTISLTSVPVANVTNAVPDTVNVLAGGLLSGGGALTGNVTISLTSVPAANVSGLGSMATQNSSDVTITGGNVSINLVNAVTTTSSTASMPTASLPLVPAGYLRLNLNGTVVKVPYYAE